MLNNILEEIGIPNDVGFDIDSITIDNLFSNERYKKLFHAKLEERVNSILIRYKMDPNMFMKIGCNLAIMAFEREKRVVLSSNDIICSIYAYFNEGSLRELSRLPYVYFNQNTNDIQAEYNYNINKLKGFLRDKISQLRNIKTLDELKEISKPLYDSYLHAYKENNSNWDEWFKNEIQRDIEKFTYLLVNLNYFIKDLSAPLPESFFEGIDYDKLKLFLATQYFIISTYLKEPTRSVLIDCGKKCIDSIHNKNVSINEACLCNIYLDDEGVVSSFLQIFENLNLSNIQIDSFLEKNKDISQNVSAISSLKASDFDGKSIEEIELFLKSKIEEAISISEKMGYEDVDLEKKVSQLKNESEKDPKKLQSIKTQIDRLSMILDKIKPDKTLNGRGKFKGFYVYIYKDSGMVAIDKIDKSAGLYIMPISVYLKILTNDKDFNTLYDVRNLIRITPCAMYISHNTENWLDIAKELICSRKTSLEEMKIFESLSTIELPYSITELTKLEDYYRLKSGELSDSIIGEIRKKKKEIVDTSKEIDEDIKSKPVSEDLLDSEKQELLDVEDELLSLSNNSQDFITLHELASKIDRKPKRSPDVSLKTKLRSKDLNGYYHCDLCDSQNIEKCYFDTHHIVPLSKGGIDNLYNTACLCKDCHTRIHFDKKHPLTASEYSSLLKNVRRRIIETTPEYILNFERLFSPFYSTKRLDGLSDEELIEEYIREEEYYLSHKDEEDKKFMIEWNTLRSSR